MFARATLGSLSLRRSLPQSGPDVHGEAREDLEIALWVRRVLDPASGLDPLEFLRPAVSRAVCALRGGTINRWWKRRT